MALAAAGKLGAAAVVDYLDRKGWRYELIEHEPTVRAVDEASASGVPPEREAKTILLTGASGRLLATIPGSERLDVRKARELQGDPHLRLATEDEMAARFPLFDVGALPPIGPLMSAPQIIDRRLTDHSRIVASAGDHSHSLLLIPAELVRRTASRVADICED